MGEICKQKATYVQSNDRFTRRNFSMCLPHQRIAYKCDTAYTPNGTNHVLTGDGRAGKTAALQPFSSFIRLLVFFEEVENVIADLYQASFGGKTYANHRR